MSDIKSLDELKDAVAAEGVVAEAAAPAREPQRDALGRSYATGKRKDAVARVWIKPGSGKVTVNGKDMDAYFARPVLQMVLRQPFEVAGVEGEFDVMATVKGGGLSGQAGAVKHGISQALQLSASTSTMKFDAWPMFRICSFRLCTIPQWQSQQLQMKSM